MTAGEMPEIEMNVDDSGLDPDDIDLTPMLLRRFAWDTMACNEVPDLLPSLGLTCGTDEGTDYDHRDSHHRMSHVLPLEPYFTRFAEILGVVFATAMAQRAGIDLGEDSVKFAEQNAEVVGAGARAIVAQFIETGVLEYGAHVRFVTMGDEGV
jgi:hypothetical protein